MQRKRMLAGFLERLNFDRDVVHRDSRHLALV